MTVAGHIGVVQFFIIILGIPKMVPVKQFFTAGSAIFTLEIPGTFIAEHSDVCPHYTYRINHKPAEENRPEAWFVQLLSGPDNTRNYSYLGMLNPETGAVALTRASKYGDSTWPVRLLRRALAKVFAGKPEDITNAGFDLHHNGRCGRCGRMLTVPKSIETGLGPVCAEKD